MLLEFDGTFIFALISFIIFVILMNVILYRPIVKIMDERQKFLDKNKDTVLTSKQKAADVLKQKDDEISDAKLSASNALSKAQEELKIQKEREISDKKNEIKEKTEELTKNLIDGKNDAKAQLKSEIRDFVKMSVSKILNEEVENVDIDEDMINKAMEGQK